jgi:hypothetical protein
MSSEFSVQIGGKSHYIGRLALDPSLAKPGGGLGHDLQRAREIAVGSCEKFEARRAEIAADVRLSDEGKREAVAKLGRELLESLEKALGGPLAGARTALEVRRAGLGSHVERDPGDLVGELRDAERRALIRSAPADQRVALARSSAPLRDAALRGGPELVGIGREAFALLESDGRASLHGERVAEAEQLGAALEHVERVVSTVRTEIATASGIAGGK